MFFRNLWRLHAVLAKALDVRGFKATDDPGVNNIPRGASLISAYFGEEEQGDVIAVVNTTESYYRRTLDGITLL